MEKMQCKLLAFVCLKPAGSSAVVDWTHIVTFSRFLSHWLKMMKKEYECVWNRLRKMWIASMESTILTFVSLCTGGLGLEDMLEFVSGVQSNHMQKEHSTEQRTQFAPLKKKQENNASLYIQIHTLLGYLVRLFLHFIHLYKVDTCIAFLPETSSFLRKPKFCSNATFTSKSIAGC